MLSRRGFLGGLSAAVVGCASSVMKARQDSPAGHAAISAIESRVGGRIGLFALATDTGKTLDHRADERFALCSTFKWLLAAAVLADVEAGRLALDQDVVFGQADVLDYAPVTARYVQQGRLSVRELAAAAVVFSDNTAANLLLDRIGGPEGLTRFLRAHGDDVTRLDRNETALNSNLPRDPRDTTSPRAMVGNLRGLLTTNALADANRALLTGWMIDSQTGAKRLRAGLPASWRVGDKSGTGDRGAANDVAIAWPPGRGPILIAAYLSDSTAPAAQLDAAHAELGRWVGDLL